MLFLFKLVEGHFVELGCLAGLRLRFLLRVLFARGLRDRLLLRRLNRVLDGVAAELFVIFYDILNLTIKFILTPFPSSRIFRFAIFLALRWVESNRIILLLKRSIKLLLLLLRLI